MKTRIFLKNIFVSFHIFFSPQTVFSQALENSHDRDAVSIFVPPEAINGVRKALQKANPSDEALGSQESVTFESKESKSSKGGAVVNRVWFSMQERFDVWLMRQSILGTNESDSNPPANMHNWAFIGIVVDKGTPATAHAKKAYYFEFADRHVNKGELPQPRPMRAACGVCHSSGPRVIRAAPNSKFAPLKVGDLKLIEKWNNIISNYRFVQNSISPHERTRFVVGAGDLEELNIPICVECHNNAADAVRGPLLRKNRESILHLVKTGAMPPETVGSTQNLFRCLQDWSEQRAQTKECLAVSTTNDLSDRKNYKKHLINARKVTNSTRAAPSIATARTSDIVLTLGDSPLKFEIRHAKVALENPECEKSICRWKLRLNFSAVQTGIQLRDKHLMDWVKKSKLEEETFWIVTPTLGSAIKSAVELVAESTAASAADAEASQHSSLKNATPYKETNQNAELQNTSGKLIAKVRLSCNPWEPDNAIKCRFDTENIPVTNFGGPEVCFLGVCIQEIAKITGQVQVSLHQNSIKFSKKM